MTGLNVQLEEGDADSGKPPLLLLHGFLSSNLQWAPNRDALRGAFRLIAVELWGHGGSPAPRDPALYSVGAYVSGFEALRERLGVESWFVCGQSFGAGISMRYALAHPESLRGLIVTNSRSALSDIAREARSIGDLETWESMDKRTLPFHPCHAKRFPADLKSRMVEAADRVEPYALWQAMQTTSKDVSCRRVASEISVPTLLVNGRFEKVFQPDRDFAVATIPSLAVVDLDAGHSVNIEAHEGFDESVIDFARRHRD